MGVYEYFFAYPDDEGENEGIIFRLGFKVMWLSIIAWVTVTILGYEMTYIFGYNLFFWIGLVGLIWTGFWMAIIEEPEKDLSELVILETEIEIMNDVELEKEKTDQTIDYSEYNKEMDEPPPL